MFKKAVKMQFCGKMIITVLSMKKGSGRIELRLPD